MKTPLISVVIPLFNKGEYIARTLRSVLEQSFAEIEVFVIDDGSTDDGAEIVKSVHDPRLTLIAQENKGVSAARNRGVAQARAEFVAFIDADDQWHPEFLSVVWEAREKHPEGRFFASSFEIVDGDGQRKWLDFGYPETFAMDLLEFMACCLRLKSPLMSSAVMVYKPLLVQIGMFPLGQKRGEDLDTWVRLLFEVPVIYLNRPLAVYWYGLPSSACVACQDVYLAGNSLLATLEERISNGFYQGEARERVLDYIAWYMTGPVDRLIASGRSVEARGYILPSLRSKRLRCRYLWTYLKSFYPSFFNGVLVSTLRILALVKTFTFFDE